MPIHFTRFTGIFKKLLIDQGNAEKACEFLDRHLRGNLTMMYDGKIYSYRDSTGFKPLVSVTGQEQFSLHNSFRKFAPHPFSKHEF